MHQHASCMLHASLEDTWYFTVRENTSHCTRSLPSPHKMILLCPLMIIFACLLQLVVDDSFEGFPSSRLLSTGRTILCILYYKYHHKYFAISTVLPLQIAFTHFETVSAASSGQRRLIKYFDCVSNHAGRFISRQSCTPCTVPYS